MLQSLLVLSDGTVFEGEAFGAEPDGAVATGEVVFNTVLSGYQEVITDPSYAGQVITFTYPHIGNYGVTATDDESRRPFCRGVIVRELARRRSNWRSTDDLDAFLRRTGVPGIGGIDTRRLTRHIRDAGAMPGAFGIVDARAEHPTDEATPAAAAAVAEPGTDGVDLVSTVTTAEPYTVGAEGEGRAHRGLRLRHQAHDPAPPGRHRPRRGGACRHERRRRAGPPARRRVPLERPRRPGHRALRRRGHQGPARRGAGVRHLPRPPAALHRARRLHREAALRPPRRQPPGAPPPHGHRGDHQPEPQLRGGRGLGAQQRGHARQPQRRRDRGRALHRHPGLQRAAPPRGRSRPPRQRLPVHGLRRTDGTSPEGSAVRRSRHRDDQPPARLRTIGLPAPEGHA